MLATIILDRFRQTEVNDVARAMDKFCQHGDTHLFASSFVYCFSDPVTHKILYIGLTGNIGLAFGSTPERRTTWAGGASSRTRHTLPD
jgi:hypothetical protein